MIKNAAQLLMSTLITVAVRPKFKTSSLKILIYTFERNINFKTCAEKLFLKSNYG